MKEGWGYKKLGEICQVLDSQRKPVTKKDRAKGIYPYYGASGIQDYVDSYIFDGRFLLVGEDGAKWGASDKSAYIIEGKSWVNNHAHILKVSKMVDDRLIEYYLTFKDLSEYITGAVVPKLTQKALISIPIPVPPLSEQQHIVEELDLLSSIIEKKKAQLNELDNMAQSLFYEMFGDPETNNKQWETKKLSKITKSEGGGTPSKNVAEYWGGDIVWVSSKDMKQTYISDSIIHITEEGVANSPAHLLPIGTILIVNRSGILKHTLPVAITTKELTINQDIKALVVNNEGILNIYLLFCIIAFSPYLLSKVKAVTVDSIDFSIFKSLDIPLPPLNLQQQFASKIEAIEHQKELIKHSIKEVETLFNSRMDYYFN